MEVVGVWCITSIDLLLLRAASLNVSTRTSDSFSSASVLLIVFTVKPAAFFPSKDLWVGFVCMRFFWRPVPYSRTCLKLYHLSSLSRWATENNMWGFRPLKDTYIFLLATWSFYLIFPAVCLRQFFPLLCLLSHLITCYTLETCTSYLWVYSPTTSF